MQFSESAAEDIQIPDEQDSENQDGAEELSEATGVKSSDKQYLLCSLFSESNKHSFN